MAKVLIVSEADLAPSLGGTIVWGRDVERVLASSPASALDVARAYVPSLVVLDGSDEPATLRLIRQLREHPGTRRSSIVVVAGREGSSLGQEVLQGGANLVLPSPVDPTLWDARLARLLAVPNRLRIRFPVRVQRHDASGDAAFTAHALDLSVTGMLVESDTGVPSGEAVEVSFTLPGTDVELQASACVVRSSRGAPACMGLSFRNLEGEAVEAIRTLLASLPVARAYGRYEALGPLGEGSMGCVYRAFDPVAQRVVAIKTLRPELLGNPQAHDYLQRFRREAQAAAKLAHPNIVTIFDVGEDYFVMELLEGRTLQQLLREVGRLGPEVACGILGPVARALDHAHSQGAIHRDVKPANVMIAPDGRPTVMDFGVVHLVSGSITGTGQVFGSPFYMAPEQISQSGASPQTDIFSLGVVAYEALTGRKPFEGEGITPILYHVVHTEPAPASSVNPDLGPHHDLALQRALAKDPAQRFSTATAFVEALFSGVAQGALPVRATSAIVGPAVPDPADPRVETQDLGAEARPFRAGFSGRRSRIAVAALAAAAAIVTVLVLRRPKLDAGGRATVPRLSITTTPPGATVWLDGEEVGTTPVFLANVPPASHRVRVAAKGYVPSELTVRTTDEATPMPIRLILQAATGTLEIDSDPPSATVSVDGEQVGTTPFSDASMSPGTHRLLLEAPGFRPFSKTVDVSSGQTEQLMARLERSTPTRSGDADELRQKGWVRVGDLVALGPGVTPPWKTSGKPAPLPETARRLGVQGTVAVALTVSEKGEVLDAAVVESAGEVLDKALLEAVRTWRYEPAASNGVKVRVRIVERQHFVLPP